MAEPDDPTTVGDLLYGRIHHLEAEVIRGDERLSLVSIKSNDQARRISELEAEVERLTNMLDKDAHAVQALLATLDARDARIKELEESLSGDATAFVNLHKQLDGIDTERNALRAEVERLKHDCPECHQHVAYIHELQARLTKAEEDLSARDAFVQKDSLSKRLLEAVVDVARAKQERECGCEGTMELVHDDGSFRENCDEPLCIALFDLANTASEEQERQTET